LGEHSERRVRISFRGWVNSRRQGSRRNLLAPGRPVHTDVVSVTARHKSGCCDIDAPLVEGSSEAHGSVNGGRWYSASHRRTTDDTPYAVLIILL
jgi:hypothetical protein